MISNELLSEVLGLTSGNAFVKEVEIRNSDIEFLCNKGGWTLLNIYELAHKCKEWAYGEGFKLLDECNAIIVTSLMDRELYIVDDDFKVPYKLERLFKACKWILDNKPL